MLQIVLCYQSRYNIVRNVLHNNHGCHHYRNYLQNNKTLFKEARLKSRSGQSLLFLLCIDVDYIKIHIKRREAWQLQ